MHSSPNWPLILQGLDISLKALAEASWPIALGLIAYSFRSELRGLLSRIKRVNAFGNEVELAALPLREQDAAEPIDSLEGTSPDLPALEDRRSSAELPNDFPLHTIFDEHFRQQLSQHVPGTAERQLAFAIRARTVSEIERIHEANYRVIFGSQIVALKQLNLLGGQAPVETFRPFYAAAAAGEFNKALYAGRSFEAWGEFLANAGYVEGVENSDPLQVRITLLGQDFLHWLVRTRVSEAKPG